MGLLEVKGRSNYWCKATEVGGEFYDGNLASSVEHGPCQYGHTCSLRQLGCTYYDLTRRAKSERIVLLNYDLWFSSNIFSEGMGTFPLVLADEVHEAANKLSSALTIVLPAAWEATMGVWLPVRSKDPVHWAKWAANALPVVSVRHRQLKEEIRGQKKPSTKLKTTLNVLYKAEAALQRLASIDKDWLVIQTDSSMTFAPIWVDRYTEALLFKSAAKVVMASATVRPGIFKLLGIDPAQADFHDYPSLFPPANRPIYFWPVARMKYEMDGDDVIALINAVDSILEQRLDRKIIIHSVSFARQKLFLRYSRFRHLMLANRRGEDIEEFVKKFKRVQGPCIMVSPSVGTGYDFPGRECMTVIIPKVPFADISHPLQQARAREDPTIGLYEAAMDLVQYAGRHIRSDTDRGETFILDSTFNLFRQAHKYMIPSWVWEAVQTIDNLPPVMELI